MAPTKKVLRQDFIQKVRKNPKNQQYQEQRQKSRRRRIPAERETPRQTLPRPCHDKIDVLQPNEIITKKYTNFALTFNPVKKTLNIYRNSDVVGFTIAAVAMKDGCIQPKLIAWVVNPAEFVALQHLTHVAQKQVLDYFANPTDKHSSVETEDICNSEDDGDDKISDNEEPAIWQKIRVRMNDVQLDPETPRFSLEVTWQPWPVYYTNMSSELQLKLLTMLENNPGTPHYTEDEYFNVNNKEGQDTIFSYYNNIQEYLQYFYKQEDFININPHIEEHSEESLNNASRVLYSLGKYECFEHHSYYIYLKLGTGTHPNMMVFRNMCASEIQKVISGIGKPKLDFVSRTSIQSISSRAKNRQTAEDEAEGRNAEFQENQRNAEKFDINEELLVQPVEDQRVLTEVAVLEANGIFTAFCPADCGFSSSIEQDLKDHLKREHWNMILPFCQLCHDDYRHLNRCVSIRNYARHFQEAHTKKRDRRCSYCYKWFDEGDGRYASHLKLHRNKQDPLLERLQETSK